MAEAEAAAAAAAAAAAEISPPQNPPGLPLPTTDVRPPRITNENDTVLMHVLAREQKAIDMSILRVRQLEVSDAVKDMRIQQLEVSDVAKDGRIRQLEVSDVAKDMRIRQLEVSNVVKDGRIRQLEVSDVAKDMRIQQLEGEVANIKALLNGLGIGVRGT